MKTSSLVFWTVAKVATVLLVGCWCVLFLRRFDLYFPFLPLDSCRSFGIALMIAGGILVLINLRGDLEHSRYGSAQ